MKMIRHETIRPNVNDFFPTIYFIKFQEGPTFLEMFIEIYGGGSVAEIEEGDKSPVVMIVLKNYSFICTAIIYMVVLINRKRYFSCCHYTSIPLCLISTSKVRPSWWRKVGPYSLGITSLRLRLINYIIIR